MRSRLYLTGSKDPAGHMGCAACGASRLHLHWPIPPPYGTAVSPSRSAQV
ncbi:hypothetical protein Hsero_1625 [Herbaspirillum seropedicae SmR1]|uniref:Uncharacterized protein n=1 Tax=Herbaspirillum seropedicae (strain SmR1) TaxID=757424 RepID=D8IQM7_HERSS|nr:hypothetical protein Hsero_1625 [Herbaspirillum seropedicae SmR1]